MQVILLERIEKLGQMGDVVTVKTGYARNYLLPQKKALRATDDNVAYFEGQRAQLEAENLTRKGEAEAVAAKMEGAAIVVIRQAGDAGHLYGSVNARDVSTGLTAEGFTTDKRQVTIERPIKHIGIHPIRVQLHPEVSVEISVNVARSTDEAQVQAERAARGEDPIATLIDEDAAAERAELEDADDEPPADAQDGEAEAAPAGEEAPSDAGPTAGETADGEPASGEPGAEGNEPKADA